MPFDPKNYLMNLRGKEYLPVAGRLVWLNEDHKRYSVETQVVEQSDSHAIVEARIFIYNDHLNTNEELDLMRTAVARKREDKTHFADFLEKAETGAIGRALGILGFGTQFAPEFEEKSTNASAGIDGTRVVDTPQAPSAKAPRAKKSIALPGEGKTTAEPTPKLVNTESEPRPEYTSQNHVFGLTPPQPAAEPKAASFFDAGVLPNKEAETPPNYAAPEPEATPTDAELQGKLSRIPVAARPEVVKRIRSEFGENTKFTTMSDAQKRAAARILDAAAA